MIKNLIDNALKHSNSEILISVDQTDDKLIIQIEDDGQGLHCEKFEDLIFILREHDCSFTNIGLLP